MTNSHNLVMVVDDDDELRDQLAETLSSAGYAVRSFRNGHEALNALHQPVKPDVILLDLAMPVLDGSGFRAIQRYLEGSNNIPVVVMSAQHDIQVRAKQLQANAWLHKPINLQELTQILARLTQRDGVPA